MDVDPELLAVFLAESADQPATLEQSLLELEKRGVAGDSCRRPPSAYGTSRDDWR